MCLTKGIKRIYRGISHAGTSEFPISKPFHTLCFNPKKHLIKFLVLSSLGLFLAFVSLESVWASNPISQNEPNYPASILYLPPNSHAILVDKSQQRLKLIASDKGSFSIVKTMICATGEVDGDKEKAGDKRTPQGIYFCYTILTPPHLASKYGICALPLNYPNFIDRYFHRDGGGIWIHGIGENRKTKSTQGCVVLGNENLAFVAQNIKLYTTPIVIVKNIRPVSLNFIKTEAEKTLDFLKTWRFAWAHGDLESYIACYAPTFTSKGMRLAQWRQYKKMLFERYHHRMKVQMGAPTIVQTPRYRVATFYQIFEASNFKATGIKRLYLINLQKEIKIIGEEWIPFSKVLHAWGTFRKKLAHLKTPPPYRIVHAEPQLSSEKEQRPYQEIKSLIQNWKMSWEKKDLTQYASFYSKRFKAKSMDLEAWKKYKLKTFKKNGPIHLTVKDLKIKPEGHKISVRFLQIYQSKAWKDIGLKEMILCQESGGWKILRERWIRSR